MVLGPHHLPCMWWSKRWVRVHTFHFEGFQNAASTSWNHHGSHLYNRTTPHSSWKSCHSPQLTFFKQNEEHQKSYLIIHSKKLNISITRLAGILLLRIYFISRLKRQGMISFMGSPMGSPWASVPRAKFCSTLHRSLMPLRNRLRQLSTILICKEYYKKDMLDHVCVQNWQAHPTQLLLVLRNPLDVPGKIFNGHLHIQSKATEHTHRHIHTSGSPACFNFFFWAKSWNFWDTTLGMVWKKKLNVLSNIKTHFETSAMCWCRRSHHTSSFSTRAAATWHWAQQAS